METPAAKPTTSGLAFRVSILGSEQSESFLKVHAQLDSEHGVVHIFSADLQTHYLTIPASRALIEWKDPAVLEPSGEDAGVRGQRLRAGRRADAADDGGVRSGIRTGLRSTCGWA